MGCGNKGDCGCGDGCGGNWTSPCGGWGGGGWSGGCAQPLPMPLPYPIYMNAPQAPAFPPPQLRLNPYATMPLAASPQLQPFYTPPATGLQLNASTLAQARARLAALLATLPADMFTRLGDFVDRRLHVEPTPQVTPAPLPAPVHASMSAPTASCSPGGCVVRELGALNDRAYTHQGETRVPNGTSIEVLGEAEGEILPMGSRRWTHVRFRGADGSTVEGWMQPENVLDAEVSTGQLRLRTQHGQVLSRGHAQFKRVHRPWPAGTPRLARIVVPTGESGMNLRDTPAPTGVVRGGVSNGTIVQVLQDDIAEIGGVCPQCRWAQIRPYYNGPVLFMRSTGPVGERNMQYFGGAGTR